MRVGEQAFTLSNISGFFDAFSCARSYGTDDDDAAVTQAARPSPNELSSPLYSTSFQLTTTAVQTLSQTERFRTSSRIFG